MRTNDLRTHYDQTGEWPVFTTSKEINVNLYCSSGCGSRLIEHYNSTQFMGIKMRCFRCGAITRTPSLDAGDIPPKGSIILEPESRRNNITLNILNLFVIGREELNLQNLLTPSSIPEVFKILDFAWIKELEQIYFNVVGEVNFKKQMDAEKRFVRYSSEYGDELTFLWALAKVKQYLMGLSLYTDDVYCAFHCLVHFNEIYLEWKHHPLFKDLARDFANPRGFLHTLSNFSIASYFHKNNNLVGISPKISRDGGTNPDLYMKGLFDQRFYFEVKTPGFLQWYQHEHLSSNVLAEKPNRVLKKAGRQINRSKPGVLVIYSYRVRSLHHCLEIIVDHLLNENGSRHRGMAACIIASSEGFRYFNPDRSEYGFRVNGILNPHFEGINPVRLRPFDPKTDKLF